MHSCIASTLAACLRALIEGCKKNPTIHLTGLLTSRKGERGLLGHEATIDRKNWGYGHESFCFCSPCTADFIERDGER